MRRERERERYKYIKVLAPDQVSAETLGVKTTAAANYIIVLLLPPFFFFFSFLLVLFYTSYCSPSDHNYIIYIYSPSSLTLTRFIFYITDDYGFKRRYLLVQYTL